MCEENLKHTTIDTEITPLSAEVISSYLGDGDGWGPVAVYEQIDSTNLELKRRGASGATPGTVILAESQTQGRGRLGRNFFSPRGSGIYCSILLAPTDKTEEIVLITTAAAVAVCRGIEAVTGKKVEVKWVNDIYLNGKKICGILTEAMTNSTTGEIDGIVLGIGINCNAVFPEELQEIAGNLRCKDGTAVERNRLVAEILKELSSLKTMIQTRSFLSEYKERSMLLGKWVTILQEPESRYRAIDIAENGALVLEDPHGKLRWLSTGEVSVRITE